MGGTRRPQPGVSRQQRVSREGLQRLEAHLKRGIRIGRPVLAQWIKRYGQPAREMIKEYGQYTDDLEP